MSPSDSQGSRQLNPRATYPGGCQVHWSQGALRGWLGWHGWTSQHARAEPAFTSSCPLQSHFRGGKLRQKEAVTHPRPHCTSQPTGTQAVRLHGPRSLLGELTMVFPLSFTGSSEVTPSVRGQELKGAWSRPRSVARLTPHGPPVTPGG